MDEGGEINSKRPRSPAKVGPRAAHLYHTRKPVPYDEMKAAGFKLRLNAMVRAVRWVERLKYGPKEHDEYRINTEVSERPLWPVVDPRLFPGSAVSQFVAAAASACNLDDKNWYTHGAVDENAHACCDEQLGSRCCDKFMVFTQADSTGVLKPSFHGVMAEARSLIGEEAAWTDAARSTSVVLDRPDRQRRLWQTLLRLGGFSASSVLEVLFESFIRVVHDEFAAPNADEDEADSRPAGGIASVAAALRHAPTRNAVMLKRMLYIAGSVLDAPEHVRGERVRFVDETAATPAITADGKPRPTAGYEVGDPWSSAWTSVAEALNTLEAQSVGKTKRLDTLMAKDARLPPTKSQDACMRDDETDDIIGAFKEDFSFIEDAKAVYDAAKNVCKWYHEYFFPRVVWVALKRRPPQDPKQPARKNDPPKQFNYERYWLYNYHENVEHQHETFEITTADYFDNIQPTKFYKRGEDEFEFDEPTADAYYLLKKRLMYIMCQGVLRGRIGYVETTYEKLDTFTVPRLFGDPERRRLFLKLVAALVQRNTVRNPIHAAVVARGERLAAAQRELESIVWAYLRISGQNPKLPY